LQVQAHLPSVALKIKYLPTATTSPLGLSMLSIGVNGQSLEMQAPSAEKLL
jgi:hypothetical protein